ncbi:MAG: RES family NAD+ phosphorylase [Bacteroidota bacterium]
MDVYRISSEKYAKNLSASGAPNRWNRENQYVIYTASSRSLATLEMVAHRNAIMGGLRYQMMVIRLPERKGFIKTLSLESLPKNWQTLKKFSLTQNYGSAWYLNLESVVLAVPSALIPQEFNFIVNTKHPDFSEVELVSAEKYDWDKRLL